MEYYGLNLFKIFNKRNINEIIMSLDFFRPYIITKKKYINVIKYNTLNS